ncbi:hypothetical protein BDN70DRAFT_803453 [Pholiota conissans]|uniref:Uncharacterized protein n=1 Tax=Pholiota conissans TaxID=109636 RepID=A0A9P5Z4R5_9AGAR|nr:hypothetical protein BDN70DRAFT_803453 [Pholiota conissans]
MIPTFSEAIVLYVAPLLALTAIILTLFALLAPTLLLHDRVALLTVSPSTALQSSSSNGADGPSIFMGVLGSCSRIKNDASISCTSAALSPIYDLSVLPGNAPGSLLSAPIASTAAFIAVAIVFMILFFMMFMVVSFSHKMNSKLKSTFAKPLFQRMAAWIGVFGFIIGLSSFAIIRVWFEKAVQDFNQGIAVQGKEGPKLIASLGNAFIMAWIGYGFLAVPVICCLTKINTKAAAGKGSV